MANYAARQVVYRKIETERKTKVLALVNSERLGLQTQIAADAIDPFVQLLDQIGPTQRISLVLDTNGGQTSAAWRLVNLLRSFAEDLEIIVPTKAMSAGTLMALGANRILMTKQAALGPIDPSLPNHPLAPPIALPNGQPGRAEVSAEAVRGYLDEARKDLKTPEGMASVWTHLAGQIHPLVLGQVFRLGGQIRNLAKDLIQTQVPDPDAQNRIIQLLCSDSGSHDYTIDRRAAERLGLNIEKPSAALYALLSELTKSYHAELQTLTPYIPLMVVNPPSNGVYKNIRGLIESTEGGCYGFVSEGKITIAPQGLQDQKSFEGWRRL